MAAAEGVLYEAEVPGFGTVRLEAGPGGLALWQGGEVRWAGAPGGDFRGWFDGASGGQPEPPAGAGREEYMAGYERGRRRLYGLPEGGGAERWRGRRACCTRRRRRATAR